jgi:transmembrane sensor
MTPFKTPIKELFDDSVDDARIDALVRRAPVLRARRLMRRRAAGVSITAALLLAVVSVKLRTERSSAGASIALLRTDSGRTFGSLEASQTSREIRLDDGSALTVQENTPLNVRQTDGGRSVVLSMQRGAISTRLRPGRQWRLELGAGLVVTAVQLPLALELTHDAQRNTVVNVTEGTATLDQPHAQGEVLRQGQLFAQAGAHVELHRGETYRMSFVMPQIAVASPTNSAPVVAQTTPVTGQQLSTPTVAGTTTHASGTTTANSRLDRASQWRTLAREQAYDQAYNALGSSTVATETARVESAEDLMTLADVARLSGHPSEAVAPLQRLLSTHGSDSNAPLAAFELGRIQLSSLRNPVAAAAAFERALSLGAPRSLEENAYVLLVDARVRAGDRAGAQDAANRYRERFANGARSADVQRALERLR